MTISCRLGQKCFWDLSNVKVWLLVKTEQIRQDLHVKVKNLMLADQNIDLQVGVFSIS